MRRGELEAHGAFVILVGPDGVGKSTVAQELVTMRNGHYFHYRPPIDKRWSQPNPGMIQVHTAKQMNVLGSLLRLARSFVLFWLGYLRSVRPALKSGAAVIGDRWAYGYLVKPETLRYSGPVWLARAMIKALPRPDLVVILSLPPAEIVSRKAELTEEQARVDLEAWRSLNVEQGLVVDAQRPARAVACEILGALTDRG